MSMELTMDNALVKKYLDQEAQAVFIANVVPYYMNALQAGDIDTFLLSIAAMWMHKWPDDQRNVLELLKAVQLDIQRAFILYRPTQAKNKPWTDILSLDSTICEIVKPEANHMSTRLREWLESVKDIPATDDEDNKSTTSSSSNIYTDFGRRDTADGHEEYGSDGHTEKVDLFASIRINSEVEKGLNIPDAHAMPPCAQACEEVYSFYTLCLTHFRK